MSCPSVVHGRRRGAGLSRAVLAVWLALMPHVVWADVIRHDLGGDLDQRIARVEQLRRAGTAVRIAGVCVSACTLYLGLPTACVMPDAQLGFHGPRTRLPGIPLPHDDFERQSRAMAAYYPAAIRDWFMTEARLLTRASYYVMSGAQAISMGARACT